MVEKLDCICLMFEIIEKVVVVDSRMVEQLDRPFVCLFVFNVYKSLGF